MAFQIGIYTAFDVFCPTIYPGFAGSGGKIAFRHTGIRFFHLPEPCSVCPLQTTKQDSMGPDGTNNFVNRDRLNNFSLKTPQQIWQFYT